MRGCKDFSRGAAFDKTGRRMGARGNSLVLPEPRGLGLPSVVGRVSSRLVGSGTPISGVRWRLLLQTFCRGNWTTDSSCSEKFE